MTTTIESAITKHAGVSSSQLRQLSKTRYFLDTRDLIEPLCNDQFEVKFLSILAGTIAEVTATH